MDRHKYRTSRRTLLRLAATAGAGAAMLALVGCGEEETQAVATAAPAAQTKKAEAVVTAVAAEKPKAAPAKVVVWMTDFNDDTQKYYEETLVPDMKSKHPEIEMDVQWPGWTDFTTKLATAFAAGIMPDVFNPGSDFVASLVYRNQVAPLDEYVARWGEKEDFYENAWDSYWGKLYHVPYLTTTDTFLYRKDYFEEAGLDPDKETYTWEEFVDAAKATTVRDGDTITRAGLDDKISKRTWLQLYWQAGGDVFNEAGTGINISNAAGVESLTFYKDLYDKHKVAVKEGVAVPADGRNAYIANLAAIRRGHSLSAASVRRYNPDGWEVTGIMEPLKHVRQQGEIDTDVLSISSQTKFSDASWEWIAHAMEPNHLLEYNKGLNFIPPRKSLASDPWVQNDPILLRFTYLLDNFGRAYRSDIGMSKLIQDELENAIYERKSIEEALADADKNVNELFSEIDFPTG